MPLPLYQVDAFASTLFTGNPAAVCLLPEWLPDATMQAIAAENNLAETAFTVPTEDPMTLRWFTPTTEVDLCGHATLATAHVLFERGGFAGSEVSFMTQSGPVSVVKEQDKLFLNFPARPPEPCDIHEALIPGLGLEPQSVLGSRDYMCVYNSEEEIRALKPDFALLAQVDRFAVMATAPGDTCDFVVRFFAPAQGIPEDPVTGSAYCTLTPYWAKRLEKDTLTARQLSVRGGDVTVIDQGERVRIGGTCQLYLEGQIYCR